MSEFNDMLLLLSKTKLPFYVKHNDYKSSHYYLRHQNLDDMINFLVSQGYITSEEAFQIINSNSIWSASVGIIKENNVFDDYDIITQYSSTMQKAIDKLYKEVKDLPQIKNMLEKAPT